MEAEAEEEEEEVEVEEAEVGEERVSALGDCRCCRARHVL